ncbi:integral membrane protein [Amycolatopsis mediterranei S699]|uniref:Integral membrane protein n=2 Tax=Amycolatopsis mediterranei TaxID=33910 RepID=A0A0H3DBE1_AMYMU|nr:membrane protein [Amycolatopsis mediterranei]ADJ47592.1 integral membrane protein [Amycolatopsis mediterranei U32]AEK44475.1 integral membrane protein [Amycolatopsis mediterranei S699]AFO79303.1 integral membrane protein [Amycolatopsis mediterranei S699]AGT86431.1 integral membrane protein [Amycolatopsis mediterranei RB]KDO11238.1 membrane protein [Amycolatopsis mediterranei]
MTATSTTRQTLWWLRFGLVAGSVLVLGTALATFLGVRASIAEVRERTAPAVLEVSLAKEAIVAAHRAAVTAFEARQARLTGPSEQYEDEIARTSQQLAQVAEHNAAGEAGSQTLLLIEGLLPSYNGFIGHAAAHFRQDPDGPLAASNLQSASDLLTAPDNGILARLDALEAAQRAALDEQLGANWLGPAITALWAVPLVLLLATLVWAQRFLARRFRRTVNTALLAATVACVLLGAGTALLLGIQSDARDGGAALEHAVDARSAATAAAAARARWTLAQVLTAQCGIQGVAACGETVTAFAAGTPVPPAVPDAPPGAVDESALLGPGLTEPGWNGVLGFGIPVLAAGIGVLAAGGLQPRLDEYRFRARREP